MHYKVCKKCQNRFAATFTNFYRHAASRDGLTPRCKKCVNEDNKLAHTKRMQENPEHVRRLAAERVKRYYKANQDVVRKRQRVQAAKRRKDPKQRAIINMRKRGGGAGLDSLAFAFILKKQKGRCAICGTKKPANETGSKGWNVDHCHKTKKVRFILCHNCNRGLGAFKDSPQLMRRAASLLERSGA